MKRTEGSFHMLGTPSVAHGDSSHQRGEPRKMRRMAYIGVYEKPTRGF